MSKCATKTTVHRGERKCPVVAWPEINLIYNLCYDLKSVIKQETPHSLIVLKKFYREGVGRQGKLFVCLGTCFLQSMKARVPDIMHMEITQFKVKYSGRKPFSFQKGNGRRECKTSGKSFIRYIKTNVQVCQSVSCSQGIKAFGNSYK